MDEKMLSVVVFGAVFLVPMVALFAYMFIVPVLREKSGAGGTSRGSRTDSA